MSRFEGLTAIITGAGRGIGKATAKLIASEGGNVVLMDLDEQPAVETLEEIKSAGGKGMTFIGSVGDTEALNNMVEETVDKFGSVEILVNNAGITRTAMMHKMTDEEWNTVIDINLKGVYNCTKAVGKHMVSRAKENKDATWNGSIVNITSIAGLRGTIGQVNYAAAKAGVIGITMAMAREWGRYRINVNAVAFGVVETRMTEVIRTDERFSATYLKQIPLGRYATTDEVARSIAFLASKDASYITGETLNVSGGLHIGF